MLVEKMPMAAGYEGFPLVPVFQADKEQADAVLAEEASLIVKAGCGSKRKAEEDGGEVTVKAKAKAAEEEAAAFATVKAKSEEVDKVASEDSDEDDEWDDDEFMARITADHAAHVEKMKALYPTIKYGDYDPKVYCHRPDPESDAWNLQKKCLGLAEIAAVLL
ncbi:unnamed protein product [Triticum turgidum subsp. durum]|uniref:Uncharacterized protein n=1 Tax=Triticum turgidum subsp. durum TaxID=4567 RepID=A0A9R1BTX6_TRITD|nr:unnamed protein product [Triticum turgidum subsp. durum]